MSLWTKLFLYLLALLVVVLILGGLLMWKRPLAVYVWMSRQELKRQGLLESVVETAVGRQTVWVGGEGRALVLLHGAGDQAGTWSKVVPSVQHQYHLIIPDLAGHGKSEPQQGPLSVGTVLSGLEALLQSLQLRDPPILAGNSLGGWVAMLYAHKHPDRVSRLVIINGGALRGERKDLTLTPASREEARRLMEALRDPASLGIPDFVLDDVVRESGNGPLNRLAGTAADMPHYLLDGRLGEVSTPVDFLWGESDKLFTLDYARRMVAQLPTARLTLIPRCGHVPQQECPSSFSAALVKILQGPPPQPVNTP